jgi:alginate O-acetyltransferase complex protein AlgI
MIYLLIDRAYRNAFLLLSSIVFYSWGGPRFIFVILGTTMLDFLLVSWMDRSSDEWRRKVFLVLSLSLNLGILFYFKYCNFFIDNVNIVLQKFDRDPLTLLEVALPIGISFYTFESLTYVVDVYRRVHKPLQNFWHYQLYIILFPKLIAGPIIRYHEIADQITDRSARENAESRLMGLFRFGIGLAKKVFIANAMAVMADEIFKTDMADLSTWSAWTGALAYTFQIYFDFSGYSDMAIGLGLFFGFKFPENFNSPYVSSSITEFWRRWHITLGNWMKNYLYIPLGGNRSQSKWRIFFNLWLVFLASGFWHGAAWTFIVWGIYHGTFLVLERLFLLKLYHRIGRIAATMLTFIIVVIGWVIFRSENFPQAVAFVRKMFAFDFAVAPVYWDKEFLYTFLVATCISFICAFGFGEKIMNALYFQPPSPAGKFAFTLLFLLFFSLALGTIASGSFNPFIYFRF